MDVLILNAKIRTMSAALPMAEALLIREGRVLALGSGAKMRALARPNAAQIDAGGRLVLPGLQDPHVHLMDGGTDLISAAALWEVTSLAELQSALARHAAGWTGGLVIGTGWQSGFFGDHNLTAAVLDAVVPDRPALVYDCNYHNACLNSAGLRICGIARGTPDPLNGHFVTAADGTPTGMLHEEAVAWARARLPGLEAATFLAGARAGQAHANGFGITGIIDPWIRDYHSAAYGTLDAEGSLTLRVSGAGAVTARDSPETALARLTDLRRRHTGDYRVNAAKFFLDGGLENRTAAMIAPYADAAGGNAPLMFGEPAIAALFTALDAARFQIHVHCIGDMATRAALDGFAAARAANGDWPSLHQIAHVEVVHPDDLPRFAALGVMANTQPLWAANDPIIPDETMALVGPDRLPFVYPFRSLIDAGAPWCLGSDFPVTTLNPFEIIETAVTRQTPASRGPRRDKFGPAQAITVHEAVAGYTLHAAAACWRAGSTGQLAPGFSGDLVVLDRDLFTCAPHDIGGTTALLTLFKGREVHRDPGFDG